MLLVAGAKIIPLGNLNILETPWSYRKKHFRNITMTRVVEYSEDVLKNIDRQSKNRSKR